MKVACRAGLWYNGSLKLVCLGDTGIPPKLAHLIGDVPMDTIPQDNTPRKQCAGPCGRTLPATTEFFQCDKRKKDGLRYRCKQCGSKQQKEYREPLEARERVRARERDRYWRRGGQNRSRVRRNARRAHKMAAPGTHTVEQIQGKLKSQKCRCYYCSSKFERQYVFHVEHVVPLVRGGSNDISNIVLACPGCNLRKNSKLPHEFFKGGKLL